MGNILQNSLDVTYDDFLKGVFGMKPKPEWNALKTIFSEIVVGKSTLVSDMSKPLRENSSKPERKRAQERVSGWLGNCLTEIKPDPANGPALRKARLIKDGKGNARLLQPTGDGRLVDSRHGKVKRLAQDHVQPW